MDCIGVESTLFLHQSIDERWPGSRCA